MILASTIPQTFRKRALLLTLSLVTSVSSANADVEHLLLTATSDAFAGSVELSLITDDGGNALAIRYAAESAEQDFPIADLATGIVVLKAADQNVIIIQGNGFDPASGGPLRIDHLVNGMNGKREQVEIAIERHGLEWHLEADDLFGRRFVSKAYFKAKKFLGKIVGIASITFE